MAYNISNATVPNPTTLATDPAFNVSAAVEYAINRTGLYTFAGWTSSPSYPSATYPPPQLIPQLRNYNSPHRLPKRSRLSFVTFYRLRMCLVRRW